MRLHRIIPAAALVSSVILLGGCSTITNLIGVIRPSATPTPDR